MCIGQTDGRAEDITTAAQSTSLPEID